MSEFWDLGKSSLSKGHRPCTRDGVQTRVCMLDNAISSREGRVRTGRDNYFMACTGREKIKVFETNQPLLPQCRPCTGTCYHLIAKEEARATERYVVSEFRRPLRPCALYVSTSLFAYGTKTLRKPKQASSLGNLCKSCTMNIDELVSCKTSHGFVPFRI